jgi:hypothetical protein
MEKLNMREEGNIMRAREWDKKRDRESENEGGSRAHIVIMAYPGLACQSN